MKRILAGMAVAAALAYPALTFPALAQHNHGAHAPAAAPPPAAQGKQGKSHGAMPGSKPGAHGKSAVPSDPASQAFAAANAKMHAAMAITFTGNADVDFARGMVPHHQGAVEMAEIVLRFGKDGDVRKLASEIIGAQRAEIAQMQAWLHRNGNGAAGPKGAAIIQAYEAINARMHEAMAMALTGHADRDFMSGMIPHHEGAVEMAKLLLRHGNDPELRKLAEDIVRSQNAEIVRMLDWLRRNVG